MQSEYQIFISKSAEGALVDIVNHISTELMEPELARGQYNRIKQTIMTLGDMPRRVPLVRDELLCIQGFRIHPVDNYHVFFVVNERQKRVDIVRVLYARRDWAYILGEHPS